MACVMRKLLFIILFTGVLITPANAQNEKNMYSYKQIENRYIVSIDNHTEIVKALNAFCKEKGIQSGSISGIGAIGELTLRFFNPKTNIQPHGEYILHGRAGISSSAHNCRQKRLLRFSWASAFCNAEWCGGVHGGGLWQTGKSRV